MSEFKIIKSAVSLSDACRKLDWPINGASFRKVKKLYIKYNIPFPKRTNGHENKYLVIEKNCPVCKKKFTTRKGHSREKTTCSYSCSNTYFRSGKNNPNWKDNPQNHYRKTAFHYKEHKCNHCGWNEVPGVLVTHHIDRNRSNGNIDNLEILCPTCHMVEHFNNNDGPFKRSKD
jgi:hypothetical protein